MYNIGHFYVSQQLENIKRSFPEREGFQGTSLLEQWLVDENFTEEEAVRNAISLLVAGLDIVKST